MPALADALSHHLFCITDSYRETSLVFLIPETFGSQIFSRFFSSPLSFIQLPALPRGVDGGEGDHDNCGSCEGDQNGSVISYRRAAPSLWSLYGVRSGSTGRVCRIRPETSGECLEKLDDDMMAMDVSSPSGTQPAGGRSAKSAGSSIPPGTEGFEGGNC
jgi:hypothetical protein